MNLQIKKLSHIGAKFADASRFSKNQNLTAGNYPLKEGKVEFAVKSKAGSNMSQIRDA